MGNAVTMSMEFGILRFKVILHHKMKLSGIKHNLLKFLKQYDAIRKCLV